ncbi:two-component sensor histidine kinase [Streptomyces daghestanicus]|uniref:histidine kinase n=1 Tax=Streptomyces daghestanicus TaxID=66885 RepID=A0ABQ3Q349_9ACTN|nr:two-component sensor histidine kinase [Streptomyces daghestanicus]GHI31710.1 two-component sensor histidine kinase [Streptomyces daghestanicus]
MGAQRPGGGGGAGGGGDAGRGGGTKGGRGAGRGGGTGGGRGAPDGSVADDAAGAGGGSERPAAGRRPRLTSLRTTFAVSFATVTAVVTVLIGVLSYNAAARLVRVDQETVFGQIVQDLRDEVREQRMTPDDFSSSAPGHDIVRPARTDVQVLGADGAVTDASRPRLPVTRTDRETAGAARSGTMVQHEDIDVGDDVYRIATVALGGGRGAVQVAQEFSDTEDLLRALQRQSLVLMAGTVTAAGLFGWWLARRITGRLVALTSAAEDVARTRRLGLQVPVPVTGYDEVGRLGRAFDRMLGRLAQSEEDQRRLIQDAGHELRTPLTSLRTNISLLKRIDELPPAAREELVADLGQEARELTDLVNELVDLAAGQSDTEPSQRVDLAEIAYDVAALAQRRFAREITVLTGGDTTADGRTALLTRALSNLVENAAKFDRDGVAPIEVAVIGPAAGTARSGHPATAGPVRVEVRDRGPGIAADDLARVFDRFYRAPEARSRPGSGLGLSIVREVALAHGGAPFAHRRAGGGSVIGFTVEGGA